MSTRKVSRREFIQMGALTGAGVMLAACAPKPTAAPATEAPVAEAPTEAAPPTKAPEPAPTTAPAEPEFTTISFIGVFQLAMEEAMNEIIAKFEEQNPHIKVDVVNAPPAPTETWTVINSALASDRPPDLFFASGRGYVVDLARRGITYDLTEWLDPVMDELIPSAIEDMSFEGKIYGAPHFTSFKFMTYNKDVYDGVGVEIPTTWEDFLSSGQKLMEAGITPSAFGCLGGDQWAALNWVQLFNQKLCGLETIARDMTVDEGAWDHPGYVEALELLVSLTDQEYFGVNPISRPHQVAQAKLFAGEAGGLYSGSWDWLTMLEPGKAPENFMEQVVFETNIWHDPAWPGEEGAVQGTSTGFAIPLNAKHPEEGAELMRFWVGAEGQQIFHHYSKYVMSNLGVEYEYGEPKIGALIEKQQKAPMYGFLDQHGHPTVWTTYGKAIEGVLNHEITPEEAMEQVQMAADEAREATGA